MSRSSATRGLAGAVATLAATLVALGLATPQSAAASGRCAPGTGVTVVVDYGPLGGGVVIACDPDGAGKAATEVMAATGFDLAYVSSQPGFVCRIEGKPGTDDEDCGDTPPADAYWGLFWSDADPATWAYSSEGAGSLELPEGGSIGWRFQDGGDREDPGAAPTGKAKSPSPEPEPEPTKSPSPQPAGPSEAASPTKTPTPSASAASGGPSGSPDGQATPGKSNPGPGAKGGDNQGAAGSKAGGDGKAGRGGKAGDGDKGGKDKEESSADEASAEQTALEPSPSVEALSPASGEPLTQDESSMALTLVAGAAVLLLGAAAGVIAWRRRG